MKIVAASDATDVLSAGCVVAAGASMAIAEAPVAVHDVCAVIADARGAPTRHRPNGHTNMPYRRASKCLLRTPS